MKNKISVILFITFFLATTGTPQAQRSINGIVKAGNLQIYYERTGKGNAIILLHAGLQDHTMWAEQVKVLSLKNDVITPDLPFHGKTTGTDTTVLAQDVIKILLDSLHIKKVSVAGLSMGASVAQDFITAYPERVNKAILISAGISGYDKVHPVDSVSMNWYRQFSKALDKGDTAVAAREFTKAWAEGIYRSGDSLKAPVSQYVYHTTLANLQLHKMEGWPALRNNPPVIESLSSVQVPVLIIDGDKDLPYITTTSQYLEKNIPGAKRVVMKGVAHMLNMEKPADLNGLIIDFLKNK